MEGQLESSLRATLPGSWYTSPELFDVESEQIFERSWMCVGREELIAEPGQLMTATVGRESVLISRDKDGALHGFLNVCRHRGSRLVMTPTASCGSTIRCPYHGWTYGLDGRLLAAPNLRDMPDFLKDRHGLVPISLSTWGGYIWCCLDEGGAGTLDAQLDPQIRDRLGSTEVLAAYEIASLRVGHSVSYDVSSNWKALVENFTECYHCPTIHPELTAAVPEFSSGYGSISGGDWHGAELSEAVEAFSSSGRASRPPLPDLSEEARRLFYGVILLPNVFLILVPDHVAFFVLEPLACNRTRVTCDWLFAHEALAAVDFDPTDSISILDITNRQDFDACERCQLGMQSRAFANGGVLVPSEHLITDFHDYVRSHVGSGERSA